MYGVCVCSPRPQHVVVSVFLCHGITCCTSRKYWHENLTLNRMPVLCKTYGFAVTCFFMYLVLRFYVSEVVGIGCCGFLFGDLQIGNLFSKVWLRIDSMKHPRNKRIHNTHNSSSL